MIQTLYHALLKNSTFRRPLRKARASLLGLVGYSDAFYDLVALAKASEANLFLDIGCHHGDTLLRVMEAGLQLDVAAFDPLASNLEIAKRKTAAYPKIAFHQLALSACDDTAAFYVNNNVQTSSLLENAEGNSQSFPEDTSHRDRIIVSTRSLDSWLAGSKYSSTKMIIKCDAQGAESKIVSGGLNSFRKSVCAFYGEVMLGDMYRGQASFGQLRHLLESEAGMVLKQIYPCLHDADGRAVEMDVLWVKPEFL